MKIWNGVRATGKWSVSDQGAVCWHVPGWGKTPCESYYYKGEELMAIFEGVHSKASKHRGQHDRLFLTRGVLQS
jgi:hypothetical protein